MVLWLEILTLMLMVLDTMLSLSVETLFNGVTACCLYLIKARLRATVLSLEITLFL